MAHRDLNQPFDGRTCSTPTLIIGWSLLFSACTSVDSILLTSNTFPPKASADEVEVLEETPVRLHQDLAELRIGDSWLSFAKLQRKILDRAATLGADAVVFAQPDTQTLHQVAYEPAYDPWGYGPYGGPFGGWSPWGGLYSGHLAVPYDETVRMLRGTAIRYIDSPRPDDRTGSGLRGSETVGLANAEQSKDPP